MAERLTDAALGLMESYVMVTRESFGRFSTNDVEALLQEIRESRARALSAEEREALERLLRDLREWPEVAAHFRNNHRAALAVLHRLLAHAPEGE
jgi:hypothetical protein